MKCKETVLVINQGEVIPQDGVIIEGTALVDESATAGVSAPALLSFETRQNQAYKGGVLLQGSITIKCPCGR